MRIKKEETHLIIHEHDDDDDDCDQKCPTKGLDTITTIPTLIVYFYKTISSFVLTRTFVE